MENDAEGQDKLDYYNRVALYETEYQPILDNDLGKEEGEGDSDDEYNPEFRQNCERRDKLSQNSPSVPDESFSKEKAIDGNNILKKIIEEEDEDAKNDIQNLEDKKELDDSIDILVNKANSRDQSPKNILFKENHKFLKF
jgi:hypothetical protein